MVQKSHGRRKGVDKEKTKRREIKLKGKIYLKSKGE